MPRGRPSGPARARGTPARGFSSGGAAARWPAAREAPGARAHALLAAGDSVAALEAFAQASRALDLARLALARGDSTRARDALFGLMARAPESDDAAAAAGVVLASFPGRTPPERVALARALKLHGAAGDALPPSRRAPRPRGSGAPAPALPRGLRPPGRRARHPPPAVQG